MPPAQRKPPGRLTAADTTAAVDQFMAGLSHRYKAEIEALRQVILRADDSIAEGIKWNGPSFRTTEYFATIHLRARKSVGLILHFGAKVRKAPVDGTKIPDPTSLLKWLGKDRAMVEFTDLDDVRARKAALQAVLRHWIRLV